MGDPWTWSMDPVHILMDPVHGPGVHVLYFPPFTPILDIPVARYSNNIR